MSSERLMLFALFSASKQEKLTPAKIEKATKYFFLVNLTLKLRLVDDFGINYLSFADS